jgi:hypothetical protein
MEAELEIGRWGTMGAGWKLQADKGLRKWAMALACDVSNEKARSEDLAINIYLRITSTEVLGAGFIIGPISSGPLPSKQRNVNFELSDLPITMLI